MRHRLPILKLRKRNADRIVNAAFVVKLLQACGIEPTFRGLEDKANTIYDLDVQKLAPDGPIFFSLQGLLSYGSFHVRPKIGRGRNSELPTAPAASPATAGTNEYWTGADALENIDTGQPIG